MPRVYDRRPRANDDHNPLKNQLDYQDTDAYLQRAGGQIRSVTVEPQRQGFANLFNRWFHRTDAQGTPDELDTLGSDMRSSWESHDTQITENTAAIANLADVAAASNVTPLWASDLQNMASFPRSLLRATTLTGNATRPKYVDISNSSNVSTGSSQIYLHDRLTPVFQPQANGASQGHIYFTPIIVDRAGVPTAIRWIAGADTSIASVNKYYIALSIYNPDTLNLEKVWDSGDIKDGAANTTSLAEVEISTGLTDSTKPGQLLFVGHQQIAPGVFQAPRRVAGIGQSGIGRPGLLLDAACYIAPNYTDGIPSSISLASLTRENGMIPWMSIRMQAVA